MPIADITLANSGAAQSSPFPWLYGSGLSYDQRRRLQGQVVTPTYVAPTGTTVAVTPTTNTSNLKTFFTGRAAGQTYVWAAGTYRFRSLGFSVNDIGIVVQDGDRHYTDPANPAILIGSEDISTGWSVNGAKWTHAWTPAAVADGGFAGSSCQVGSTVCLGPDVVYYDGVALMRVASSAAVTTGTFYIDYAADLIWIGDTPTSHTLEIGAVRFAFIGASTVTAGTAASGVTVSGFQVKQFANQGQRGAIETTDNGSNWLIEKCYVSRCHGMGVGMYGSGNRLAESRIEYCGQGSVKSIGTDNVIEDNRFVFNKIGGATAGWKAGWEGGFKVGRSMRPIIRRNYWEGNYGSDNWFDVAVQNGVSTMNVSVRNQWDGGSHIEGSYDCDISYNLFINSGTLDARGDSSGWPWGAGIEVNTSARTNAHHNAIIKCRGGIGFIEQPRGGINETQSVTPNWSVSGFTSYTLTFSGQTTTSFTSTTTPAAMQTALEALSTIGAANVEVTGSTGGPFNVTFVADLRGQNVPALTATKTGGTDSPTQRVVIAEVPPGATDILYRRDSSTRALVNYLDPGAELLTVNGSSADDNFVVMADTAYAGRGTLGQYTGAVSTGVENGATSSIFTGGLYMRRNTFYVDTAAQRFKWAGTTRTGALWQSTYPTYISGNTFNAIAGWSDSFLPVGLTV